MRGVSPLIAEIMLIGVAVMMLSSAFYFFQDTLANSRENIEEQGKKDLCDMNSNFIIESVDGRNVTIWNNGGSELDLEQFTAYLNDIPTGITLPANTILGMNEHIVIVLDTAPSGGDLLRMSGSCSTGDEI